MASLADGSDEQSLRTIFDAAVDIVHRLPKQGPISTSNSEKLRFYALYKQATVGACTSARPAFWNTIERFKWDAWHKLHDMSPQEAMSEYVRQMRQMIEKIRREYDVTQWLNDPNDSEHMRQQLALIGVDLSGIGDTERVDVNAEGNESTIVADGTLLSSSPSDDDAFTDAKESVITAAIKNRGKSKQRAHRSDSDEQRRGGRRGHSSSPNAMQERKLRGGSDTDWILFESGMFGHPNSRRSRESRRNGGHKARDFDGEDGNGSGSNARRPPTSSSSSGSGDYSPLVSWDPHMASVLFRLHRQLQHIQRQLDAVEGILDDQRQAVHAALHQRYVDDHYYRLYFFKDLPWRTIFFILGWPFIVNILCRMAYRRFIRMRVTTKFSRRFL
jgi:diazepam-binding inhibitor (GABA receptor modulating acyl-CoA-binding protein)